MSQRRFQSQVKSNFNKDLEPVTYRAWSKWEEGDVLIGQYTGKFQTKNKFDKKDPNAKSTVYKVKVLEANFMVEVDGKKVSPVGLTLALNQGGRFTKFMENEVQEGWGIELHYDGKKKGFQAGDDTLYHQFPTLEAGPLEEGDEDEVDNAEAGL